MAAILRLRDGMKSLKRLLLAAGFAGVALVSGCAVHAYDSGYDYYATTAPPAPVYETYGPAPYGDAIWINGYWGWSSNRYVWRHGHWDHRRHGYTYVPHRWQRDGRGWRMQAGHWRRVY
jgi:hypothetical protein